MPRSAAFRRVAACFVLSEPAIACGDRTDYSPSTVDPTVYAQVIAAASAEVVSVSAWLTDAARSALRIKDGLAAVAEGETEHGAFTEAELDAARARRGASSPRRRSA